jgi:hypothetical protein
MKRLVVIAFILLCTGESYGQVKSFQDLVGRWQVMGDQVAGSGLVVADSSNIILTYNGEKRKVMDYKIDFSKSPVWFDFSVQDGDSVLRVQSILELIDSSNLKWQLFLNEARTEKFTPAKGEFFYLKKSLTSTL